jgi:hypothetical protein
MPFFILEARDSQRATRHVAASEPSSTGRQGPELLDTWWHESPPQQGGEAQSYCTRGGTEALPRTKKGSGAAGHVVALEPSPAGRWGPELLDTWRHQSPPQRGGRVQSCWICGGTNALLSGEAGSRAAGHMATPKPSSAGGRDLELLDM